MMLKLAEPTAVVCHDAGAANVILAWMEVQPRHNWRPLMQGPAANIWAKSTLQGPTYLSLDEALSGAKLLLSGTGWASAIEHQALLMAKAQGIHSIAVIDHWVNYEERFVRDGVTVLPDEIYVTDAYALRKAQQSFPCVPIQIHSNLYLENLLREISAAHDDSQEEVLYLLEPIRAHWPRNVAGEFEALNYFLTHLDTLRIPRETLLRLRPHPSEPKGKYAEWMAAHANLNLALDDGGPLAQSIARARWVVGCETYAMVVALAAGRHVVSTLPPWAPDCRLPQEGIIRLKAFE